MQENNYFDYVYKVAGENLSKNPNKLFDSNSVYLFIDKSLNLIWIWAGLQSRLFHRYIAANWAGKLKNNKEFYGFKYEVIKEGREPIEFQYITSEIKRGPENYNFPGESRNKNSKARTLKTTVSNKLGSQQLQVQQSNSLNRSKIKINRNVQLKISQIVNEIKEIHSHVKYSIQHIDKRINQLEELLKNL
ncbi:MAG: hypothetical protein ACFFDK_00225 [Promethearchaeota archaeon]